MNTTNEQELEQILEGMYHAAHTDGLNDVFRPKPKVELYKQLITAYTNAEIAKVLDRLESELNEQKKAAETNLAYHTDVTKNERLIRDWQGTVHGIEFCRPAIQAERAKRLRSVTLRRTVRARN